MKRRDFLQGMGTGLLSTMIMPGLLGRVLVHQVGRSVPLYPPHANEWPCRIVAVGIGPFAAASVAMLSRDLPDISCHQVLFNSAERGSDLGTLLPLVRSCDLLFLLSGFDDAACLPLFEGVGAAARESDVLTVGVVPDGTMVRPARSSASSFWPVSLPALSSLAPHSAPMPGNTSGWDSYAMRHLVVTVTDILQHHSLICVDFADVRCIMTSNAHGRMGVGVASIGSARVAAMAALERLRGQGFDNRRASGFLVCVRSSSAMTMEDFDEVAAAVHRNIPDSADIICSIVMDETMGGNIKVTILATAASSDARATGSLTGVAPHQLA